MSRKRIFAFVSMVAILAMLSYCTLADKASILNLDVTKGKLSKTLSNLTDLSSWISGEQESETKNFNTRRGEYYSQRRLGIGYDKFFSGLPMEAEPKREEMKSEEAAPQTEAQNEVSKEETSPAREPALFVASNESQQQPQETVTKGVTTPPQSQSQTVPIIVITPGQQPQPQTPKAEEPIVDKKQVIQENEKTGDETKDQTGTKQETGSEKTDTETQKSEEPIKDTGTGLTKDQPIISGTEQPKDEEPIVSGDTGTKEQPTEQPKDNQKTTIPQIGPGGDVQQPSDTPILTTNEQQKTEQPIITRAGDKDTTDTGTKFGSPTTLTKDKSKELVAIVSLRDPAYGEEPTTSTSGGLTKSQPIVSMKDNEQTAPTLTGSGSTDTLSTSNGCEAGYIYDKTAQNCIPEEQPVKAEITQWSEVQLSSTLSAALKNAPEWNATGTPSSNGTTLQFDIPISILSIVEGQQHVDLAFIVEQPDSTAKIYEASFEIPTDQQATPVISALIDLPQGSLGQQSIVALLQQPEQGYEYSEQDVVEAFSFIPQEKQSYTYSIQQQADLTQTQPDAQETSLSISESQQTMTDTAGKATTNNDSPKTSD